jgi:hypothetical protein
VLKEFYIELNAWAQSDDGQTKIDVHEARIEVGSYMSESHLVQRLTMMMMMMTTIMMAREVV